MLCLFFDHLVQALNIGVLPSTHSSCLCSRGLNASGPAPHPFPSLLPFLVLTTPFSSSQGLGKTMQAISILGYLKVHRAVPGPHLICAPKTTLPTWMTEIARWCPALRAVKFHGNQEERV